MAISLFAAKAIVQMYGLDMARRQGVSVESFPEHVLQQSTTDNSELEALAKEWGVNGAAFNKGMMSQMQQNPDDTTSDCYVDTAASNVELIVLSDFTAYTLGGFDAATFFELFKIWNIKYLQ